MRTPIDMFSSYNVVSDCISII